ncbi:MAG: zf-HC2 domain-containing protein, partial [Planctomycetes bacterium]|nr:zf-HC2 domain-containing protein [Planctomycetota bacterium]
MTCESVRPRLSEWIDDELDPGEVGRVADHLSICPSCRREEQALRNVKLLVGAKVCRDPAPPGLAERVEAALESRRRRRDLRVGWIASP